MKIGYITGAFDQFNLGHLNLLRDARGLCDQLVVGVTTDELAAYRGPRAVVAFEERLEIVRACRHVDAVVVQTTREKLGEWEKLRFDVMFVGDDWFKNARWQVIEQQLAGVGVKIVYLPESQRTESRLNDHVRGKKRHEKVEDFLPGADLPQLGERRQRVA